MAGGNLKANKPVVEEKPKQATNASTKPKANATNLEKFHKASHIVCGVAIFLFLIAVIATYCFKYEFVQYATNNGEIVGNAIYFDVSAGKECGALFVIAWLAVIGCAIGSYFMKKSFILRAVPCAAVLIALTIFLYKAQNIELEYSEPPSSYGYGLYTKLNSVSGSNGVCIMFMILSLITFAISAILDVYYCFKKMKSNI